MLGLQVIYTLTDSDVMCIRHQRLNASAVHTIPSGGLPVQTGLQVAAVITGKNEAEGTVNLKLLLDGHDTFWVSSVPVRKISRVGEIVQLGHATGANREASLSKYQAGRAAAEGVIA